MAREKDENKRIAVLQSSKLLFSSKGFVNTSIADIVRETGMSVGTIYTYFKSKDEIVRAIVEEGWRSLYSRVEAAMAGAENTQARLQLLVENFLPELLQDLPLINILLSEAIDYTRLEEKVETLTDLVFSLLKTDRPEAPGWPGVSRQMLRTGLIVVFLGVLNAVKIARRSSLGIRTEDIIGFVDVMARGALGVAGVSPNAFARGVVRLRVPILIATALITVVLGYFLKDTRINSDVFSYLPARDPAVQLNRYIGKQYGGTQLAVVGLEAEDVFAPAALDSVRRLTAALEEVDGVEWVTSLANVLDIRKVDDDLQISPLLEAGEEGLREYALAKPMYRGRLVSADGRVTILACRLREEADAAGTARLIRRAAEDLGLKEKLYFAGLPFQVAEINRLVSRDVLVLVPIAAVLILLALALSFRSVRGVLLPLASVLISTIWTIGIMNLFRVSFSIITNVIPVVLLSTGSAYGIHVVSAFGETPPPGEGRRERTVRSLALVAVPVLLAGLTTMAGFLSFVFGSYLTMIREFGIFSCLGVLLALVVSLTFVPAVLSYLPLPERRRAGGTALEAEPQPQPRGQAPGRGFSTGSAASWRGAPGSS